MTHVTATRAAVGAIQLTVYDAGEPIAVTLEPRRALLLGADLVRLAAEGELTLEKAQLTLWGPARWGENPKLG
jgi:hypothetical protein